MDIVSKADDLFQEKIEEEGLLLCKMDRADMIEYEALTGKSILDTAKRIILSYSSDGTLAPGLAVLQEKSKQKDGPHYVGYLIVKEMRKEV